MSYVDDILRVRDKLAAQNVQGQYIVRVTPDVFERLVDELIASGSLKYRAAGSDKLRIADVIVEKV